MTTAANPLEIHLAAGEVTDLEGTGHVRLERRGSRTVELRVNGVLVRVESDSQLRVTAAGTDRR